MYLEEYMVKYINDYRITLGLKKLWTDRSLTTAAGLHARHLARKGKLTHNGEGGGPMSRVKECGYVAKLVAENVAMSTFSGPKTIFNEWCGSRGHRANMLIKDAEDIGVAVVTANCVDYWVALFGTRNERSKN